MAIEFRKSLFEVILGELVGDSLFFYQSYEPYLERYFLKALRNISIFVDIGANVGVYSVMAAKQVDRVLSVEPSPTLRVLLQRNVELNKLSNVTICDCAITDKDGECSFYENLRADNFGVGKIFPAGYPGEHELRINVKGLTLDSLALVHGLNKHPCLIKMDIEGAEFKAINGGNEFLSKKDAPILFIEIHPPEMNIFGDSLEVLFHKLTELGYTVRDVLGLREISRHYFKKSDHFTVICTKANHLDLINSLSLDTNVDSLASSFLGL